MNVAYFGDRHPVFGTLTESRKYTTISYNSPRSYVKLYIKKWVDIVRFQHTKIGEKSDMAKS